jgi:hypothetical protein
MWIATDEGLSSEITFKAKSWVKTREAPARILWIA